MRPQRVSISDPTFYDGRRSPWLVKWRVDGKGTSRGFRTKALAQQYWRRLLEAQDAGHQFQPAAPYEPLSWHATAQVETFVDHAQHWVTNVKWAGWSAHSRKSAVEAVVRASLVLLRSGAPALEGDERDNVRRYLADVAFRPKATLPAELEPAAKWVQEWSKPLADLGVDDGWALLDSLCTTADGSRPNAVNTRRRYIGVIQPCLSYAVARKRLQENPVDAALANNWRPPAPPARVPNRRLVLSPTQVRACLAAIPDEPLMPYLATMAFAGLRPAEVSGLLVSHLELPEEGWGMAQVTTTLPTPGSKWTNDEESHEERNLKAREQDEVRRVPLPPELVQRLVAHLELAERKPDDLVFVEEDGTPVEPGKLSAAWRAAKAGGLPAGSPLLAARPYDLRHSNATFLIRAGVPATEAARRLGHSPEVMMRIYSGWFEEDEELGNDRLAAFLAQG